MVIKTYNKNQLSEFIDSDFYRILSRVPISYHRAVSQLHNPYADEEDVLLWVAYENAATVGYLGVLPDKWDTGEIQADIRWLSCFWVDENHRQNNVASTLMMSMLREHKHQLMISNFLFSLEESYQKIGVFHPICYKHGVDLYIRARFTRLIVSKYPRLNKLKAFIASTETLVNQLFSFWQWIHPRLKTSESMKIDASFDEELDAFLLAYTSANHLNRRTASYFKWIYEYRWVLEGKKDKQSDRYYFSSVSDRFTYLPVKIYDTTNTLTGFAFLKIRDNNLTVSFLYADDRDLENLANYIFNLVKSEHIDVISCFDTRLCHYLLKAKSRYIIKRKRRQPYLFPLPFNCDLRALQEGEGDSVFT